LALQKYSAEALNAQLSILSEYMKLIKTIKDTDFFAMSGGFFWSKTFSPSSKTHCTRKQQSSCYISSQPSLPLFLLQQLCPPA
jgi:hypothetical protein